MRILRDCEFFQDGKTEEEIFTTEKEAEKRIKFLSSQLKENEADTDILRQLSNIITSEIRKIKEK